MVSTSRSFDLTRHGVLHQILGVGVVAGERQGDPVEVSTSGSTRG